MRIRINKKKVRLHGEENEYGKIHDIYAIGISKAENDVYYYIENNQLCYIYDDTFEVIDPTIPNNWIFGTTNFNDIEVIYFGPKRFVEDHSWRYDLITLQCSFTDSDN